MSDVKIGDKVEVTLKGEVTYINNNSWGDSTPKVDIVIANGDYEVEYVPLIEGTYKIEAKPQRFKVGTVVKHKFTSSVYTVLEGRKVYSHSAEDVLTANDLMTTEYYDVLAGPGVED